MKKLSIIIPAYQEANRIGSSLERLCEYLAVNNVRDVEVLAVVAESPDGTLGIAQAKTELFNNNFRVIEAGPRAGKGRDVKLAIMEAKGEYKLFMDADLATPLHHIDTILQLMAEKADVIIGVRDLQSIHIGLRKFISTVGNLLIRKVLGLDFKDTQCGFKAFHAPVADDLFGVQTINGWGFDIELLAIATERGYNICTIPIYDWKDVDGGTFENTAVKGALSTLKDLAIIKWNLTRGIYSGSEHAGRAAVLQDS